MAQLQTQTVTSPLLCIEPGVAIVAASTSIAIQDAIEVILPVIIYTSVVYYMMIDQHVSVSDVYRVVETRGPPQVEAYYAY